MNDFPLSRKWNPHNLSTRPCKMWALPPCLASCSNVSGLAGMHWWPGLLGSPHLQPSRLAMAGSSHSSSVQVASFYQLFLSYHLFNSLHCIFQIYIYLVCFLVYLSPLMGFTFHKSRDLLSCEPRWSWHSAGWRAQSRCSINICLVSKMNEDKYEITRSMLHSLI